MKEIVIYSGIYLALFGITEWLYHKQKFQAETTRKIVHICTGIIALTFPSYLLHLWQTALLCGSFLLLMFVSERYRWFKSITAVERKSYGSWLFAVVVLLCFFIQQKLDNTTLYFAPILVLSLADPMAAFIGKKLHFKPFTVWGQTKTLGGTLAFMATCFVILLILNTGEITFSKLLKLLLISGITAVVEAISTKGWDNLTIPISIIVLLYFFN
ncbi:MAG: phosphatidate cytidylyltransferase [Flavobacteriales bacterium]|nr:phosphatidate cytidylyltransferase [Flavobacteriales bacterium]